MQADYERETPSAPAENGQALRSHQVLGTQPSASSRASDDVVQPTEMNRTSMQKARTSSKDDVNYYGRVRVVVRCRPLQPATEDNHSTQRVRIQGNEIAICDKVKPKEARSFTFDRVLAPEADQAATFAEVAPLVDHVLDGLHATVFAYGQTGSGKTYTMDGLSGSANLSAVSQRERLATSSAETCSVDFRVGEHDLKRHGILPRVIQVLFDRARERQGSSGGVEDDADAMDDLDGVEYIFRCSYYQIYNEKITDLLRLTDAAVGAKAQEDSTAAPSLAKLKKDAQTRKGVSQGELRVRWHKGDVFKVENLFVCACHSANEMRNMLLSGIKQRIVSSHLMNNQSSRSHCVFTIYVERRARRNDELLSRSEFSLVDLAGSEKIGLLAHNPTARLVKESIDINTSLLALGKVITALGSGGGSAVRGRRSVGGAAHIPYRDSKLTMLLKHALGGNSLTTMIACISPSDRYVDETMSTLLYAGRAKNIRNVPHVNEDPTAALTRQLREEIVQLKTELGLCRTMAATSLLDRETAPTFLCARCGHSGDPATDSRGPGSVASIKEVDQLADSLVTACDMLHNLIRVNGQLRESYDTLRDVQEAAERREAQLNAENLALRERLSVLESIVLQGNDNNNDDVDNEEEEGEDVEVLERRKSSGEVKVQHWDVVGKALESSAVPEGAASAHGPSLELKKGTTATASNLHTSSGWAEEARGAPDLLDLSRSDKVSATAREQPRLPCSAVPAAPTALRSSVSGTSLEPIATILRVASAPPAQGLSVPSSNAVETPLPQHLHDSKKNKRAVGGPAGRSPKRPARNSSSQESTAPPAAMEEHEGRQCRGRLKGPRKKRAYRTLVRRLRDYEVRYREPRQTETYADYYQQLPPRCGAPQTTPGLPAIRASGPPAPQITAALADMRVTVAKLPKAVVPEYVPISLLQPGLFGSLAFGGTDADKALFEQKRNDRAARLQALQQRQQELYQSVHKAVNGEVLARPVGSGEVQRPSLARTPTLRLPEPYEERPTRRMLETEMGGDAAHRYSETQHVASSSRLTWTSREPREHRCTATRNREANEGRLRPPSTLSSMAQLMEYFEKEC